MSEHYHRTLGFKELDSCKKNTPYPGDVSANRLATLCKCNFEFSFSGESTVYAHGKHRLGNEVSKSIMSMQTTASRSGTTPSRCPDAISSAVQSG
jgi:hypothetical protein